MTTNQDRGNGAAGGGVDLQPAVEAEYLALAALLEPLSDEQWDTPSLCAGWRIREVAAHVTMPARYSQERFMAELRDCAFDFGVLSDKVAARDAALPTAELVAGLRSGTLHHFTSPDGGWPGALSHAVIHGLDMAVPLGAAGRVPPGTVTAVLDGLAAGGVAANFGVRLDGRGLRATDLDWSFGSGPELSGTAEDLVLALSGRTLPPGRLAGDPL
ncbi:maleylpyruvate isomerase family mycothiol-dependent enzyme [Streptomyces sp. NPDC004031]